MWSHGHVTLHLMSHDLQIALHAEGETDETPFAFGSSIPGLVFHWSVTNMDVHGLTSVYDKVLCGHHDEGNHYHLNRQGSLYKKNRTLHLDSALGTQARGSSSWS